MLLNHRDRVLGTESCCKVRYKTSAIEDVNTVNIYNMANLAYLEN